MERVTILAAFQALILIVRGQSIEPFVGPLFVGQPEVYATGRVVGPVFKTHT